MRILVIIICYYYLYFLGSGEASWWHMMKLESFLRVYRPGSWQSRFGSVRVPGCLQCFEVQRCKRGEPIPVVLKICSVWIGDSTFININLGIKVIVLGRGFVRQRA